MNSAKLTWNTTKTTPLTVEQKDGQYYLMSGFSLFNVLYSLHVYDRIPFRLLPTKSNTTEEILLKQLKQGIDREVTSWRFKYYLIDQLTNQHQVEPATIATYLNKERSFVEAYLLYEEIPDEYKQQAIRTGTSHLVNEIYLHPAIPENQKLQYYRLAVTGAISMFDLYIAASYFHMSFDGYYLYPFPLSGKKS
ncbi:hypothetical protein [Aquibacillus sediminis]|uniref:hypothetical protein n=1 Tax=Aquibacillus sediminis TaxID=2574734 RepID=UPI00110998FA|nr:hypothetical protein [Aquibacillus sediminis]